MTTKAESTAALLTHGFVVGERVTWVNRPDSAQQRVWCGTVTCVKQGPRTGYVYVRWDDWVEEGFANEDEAQIAYTMTQAQERLCPLSCDKDALARGWK